MKPARLAAIDVMRGFVMVVMSIDHASDVFNGHRFFSDAAFMPNPPSIDPAQFFTRWISHLCAPTFVALAGTALAMSTERRRASGQAAQSIDRHIMVRALLLLFFEVAWMSWALIGEWGVVLLQVLYALGGAFLFMIPLRRLPDWALFAVGVVFAIGSEGILGILVLLHASGSSIVTMLLSGGVFYAGKLIVGYPIVPWLGMMCLGWVFGRRLLAWRARGEDEARLGARVLLVAAGCLLAVYVVLRGLNGFGNMTLYRAGPGVIQWLRVSKYPASATYVGLELGLACLLLAALFRLGDRVPALLRPLHLLGQTALFYYLLHVHVLALVAFVLGWRQKFGLGSAYLGAAAALIVLYPACVWYRGYKARHPTGWAQWI